MLELSEFHLERLVRRVNSAAWCQYEAATAPIRQAVIQAETKAWERHLTLVNGCTASAAECMRSRVRLAHLTSDTEAKLIKYTRAARIRLLLPVLV